ncbi:MAG: DNA sulfur modification protein DndD [Xenococcaceae cyanobacterium MO_167.B27]|nr:DNA sulfur modification protein DndD [Xenococcaceae cyanobacterium MO_167.B27]
MIFTELVLENFGAYASRNVINLRPENNDNIRPIILFGGMNGGGKTTLMDAIRLALYGNRAKCSNRGNLSYGDFLNQCINSQIDPGKITKIELSFEQIYENNWQNFTIIRAWNKNLAEGKDSLSIIREGGYDSTLEANWDEYIEDILPLGISNLFLFDGEQVKELAELETPPQSVVDAINSLLGLELAERLSVDLDVLVSRKQKSLASKTQLETLEEIEDKIAEKRKQQDEAKQNKVILDRELQKAYKKRDRAYDKFRKEGGKIASERDKLQHKIELLNNSLELQQGELRKVAESSLPLMLITDLLNNAITQGKQEIKIKKLQQAQDIIEDRDNKLLSYLQLEALSNDVVTKIKHFIEQENKTLVKSLQLREDNYLDIGEEELQKLISFKQDRLSFQQQLGIDATAKLKELELEKDNLENQMANAASPEAYQKLDDAVQEAEKEVNKCKAAYDAEEKRIDTLRKEINLAEQELKRILKQCSEQAIDRINDEHIINSVARVQETLKLFREKLTLKKLNKLENEVTECFRYLLHKSNLVHRIAIETESYRLSLYDPQGILLPKQRLSAGEKQLLAIAFLWGLARVSGKNLPVAIDTPLGRLDSSHRTNLIERYFPSASHQVILLSTDTEIGKDEIDILRNQDAIAREYLIKYDHKQSKTTVKPGYFW